VRQTSTSHIYLTSSLRSNVAGCTNYYTINLLEPLEKHGDCKECNQYQTVCRHYLAAYHLASAREMLCNFPLDAGGRLKLTMVVLGPKNNGSWGGGEMMKTGQPRSERQWQWWWQPPSLCQFANLAKKFARNSL